MISQFNNIKNFFTIIHSNSLHNYYYFPFLYIFNFLFEIINIGLIIPFIQIIINEDSHIRFVNFFNDKDITQFLSSKNNLIFLFACLLLLANLFKASFLTFYSLKLRLFLAKTRSILSVNIYERYLNRDYIHHVDNNSSKLLVNITEIGIFILITESTLVLIGESIIFIGFVVFLLFYNPQVTLITIFLIIISSFIFYQLISKKNKYWGQIRKNNNYQMLNCVKEGIGAIKELKILGRIDDSVDRVKRLSKLTAQSDYKQGFYVSLTRIWFELLGISGLCALIMFMIFQEKDLKEIIIVLTLFLLVFYRLIPSVSRILNAIQNLTYHRSVINSVYSDLQFNNTKCNFSVKNNLLSKNIIFNNNISLKNIYYKYRDQNKILFNGLNFEFKKGKFYGIYGNSGVGKSSLLNIILGLIKPDQGQVLVDDVDININIPSWNKIISYVPQDIYLNDESIIENIALGVPKNNINPELIKNSIILSGLDSFINNLPEGINSRVGELGDKISGGQKQRIGIARALYNENSQLLILDEATNALDSKAEKEILSSIYLAKKNKTIIFISHKFNIGLDFIELYELINFGLKKKI
jgi:ABC-type bacteriocin/lantibiotic exporter with double-glycine peptidase domain